MRTHKMSLRCIIALVTDKPVPTGRSTRRVTHRVRELWISDRPVDVEHWKVARWCCPERTISPAETNREVRAPRTRVCLVHPQPDRSHRDHGEEVDAVQSGAQRGPRVESGLKSREAVRGRNQGSHLPEPPEEREARHEALSLTTATTIDGGGGWSCGRARTVVAGSGLCEQASTRFLGHGSHGCGRRCGRGGGGGGGGGAHPGAGRWPYG